MTEVLNESGQQAQFEMRGGQKLSFEDARNLAVEELSAELTTVAAICQEYATRRQTEVIEIEPSKTLSEIYPPYMELLTQTIQELESASTSKDLAKLLVTLEEKRPSNYFRRHDASEKLNDLVYGSRGVLNG